MAKAINIYLNGETLKKCKEYQNKYKVSLSTLANEIVNRYWIFKACQTLLTIEYICKTQDKKRTTIKPKNDMFKINENVSMIYSNALFIFMTKQEKLIGLGEMKEKVRNEIYNALQEKREIYWNYNDQIRNTRRMIKSNPEYWERVIKAESQK